MKTIYLIVFLSISLISSGQSYDWGFNLGTNSNWDIGEWTAIDNSGNVYVAGRVQNDTDLDPGVGTSLFQTPGANNSFVVKYDSNGNYLWAVTPELGALVIYDVWGDVHLNETHGLYLTGTFSDTIDMDHSVGTAIHVSTGNQNMILAKYSTAGVFEWSVNLGDSISTITPYSITTDDIGNVYVTGTITGTIDFDAGSNSAPHTSANSQTFILKYDALGNYIWHKILTGSSGTVGYLGCKDYELIITGRISSGENIDLNPGSGTLNLTNSGTNNDLYIAKYDSSGAFIWGNGITGGRPNVEDVAIDDNKNIYLVGDFGGFPDFDFGPGQAVVICTPSSFGQYKDAFIASYDSLGNYRWAFNIGSSSAEVATSVSVNNQYIHATGYIGGTSDFNPDTTINYNLTPSGNQDWFLAQYDFNGNFKTAYIGEGDYAQGRGISSNNSGDVVVTGMFGVNTDVDIFSGTSMLNTFGGNDLFIGKYNNISGPLSVANDLQEFDVVIFPNPTSENVFIQIDSNSPVQKRIELYSVFGQKLHSIESTESIISVDVSSLTKGNYLVKIITEEKQIVKKICVN